MGSCLTNAEAFLGRVHTFVSNEIKKLLRQSGAHEEYDADEQTVWRFPDESRLLAQHNGEKEELTLTHPAR